MENNGIDDILIGANHEQEKPRRGGLWLIIILLLGVAAWFGVNYFNNNIKESKPIKEQFIEQLSSTNIKDFLNNPLYENIYSRLAKENFEIENDINFTNSIENFNSDYLKNIDFSKFIIKLNSNRIVEEDTNYSEVLLKYSGNEILNFKSILTSNNMAIYSDELYDKYVAVEYDELNKIFGTTGTVNYIKNLLKNKDRIELTKLDLTNYYKKYKENILSSIDEESFTKNENFAIKKGDNNIEVTSYELNLDSDKFNKIVVDLLDDLKNDQTLINKIITGKDDSLILDINGNAPIIQDIKINGEEYKQSESTKPFTKEDIKNDIINILLGKKINISYNNFVTRLNYVIDYFANSQNENMKVIVYSSTKGVEKISLELPSNISIDIEFPEEASSKEKNIKITYIEKNTNKGFSLNISKTENVANATVNALYSFIEEGKINRKININLNTDGTINSNSILNDFVISYLTNEGELKCSIDNKIKFSTIPKIERLSISNCLYLNQLSEEEYITTVQLLYNKAISLYNEKRESLNFIDFNTDKGNIASTKTVDEARKALYNKVSEMMTKAVEEGREFTIQDLRNLTIDGYDVTVNLNEENAIIIVDIYMFSIDKNFYLEDVE